MSLGLPNHSSDPDRQYTFFPGIRVRSSHTLEIQMPSLRVALMTRMTREDNDQLRLQELEALDEKLLQAQQHIELYQARISKAFNKKVKQRIFQKGDLVLAVRRPMIMTHKTKGKFQPNRKDRL